MEKTARFYNNFIAKRVIEVQTLEPRRLQSFQTTPDDVKVITFLFISALLVLKAIMAFMTDTLAARQLGC